MVVGATSSKAVDFARVETIGIERVARELGISCAGRSPMAHTRHTKRPPDGHRRNDAVSK